MAHNYVSIIKRLDNNTTRKSAVFCCNPESAMVAEEKIYRSIYQSFRLILLSIYLPIYLYIYMYLYLSSPFHQTTIMLAEGVFWAVLGIY